ncbi:MAG TPA: AMP-binding protein [Pyrinomonadaceae bacterium]|nr:AMP-binding protein [Pyrinomonadaceae bacterium]
MRETINSYLEDYERRGRETAFAYRRGLRQIRWSYRRVAEAARRFSRELGARGVGRGDRVLLWAENCPEWVAAFFGCTLRGAVVVPLDLESAPDFAARVARQTSARLLLTSAETRERAARLGLPALELEELEQTIARHPAEPAGGGQVGTDDIVEIIFTSGTTAEPRGVVLTHRNLLANLAPLEEEIAKYLRWERLVHPLRFLNLLPLSHVFGQFMGIFVPQLLGGEVHFQDSLNPSEVIERVRRQRISVVVTVPRLLETLREHVERQEAAAGRAEKFRREIEEAKGSHPAARLWKFRRVHRRFGWKFWAFIAGGATLPEETETFWRRLGFAVLQGYGMTETASLISVNHPFKSGRGSVGKILPGHEVRLAEDGEILVRGANVSPGYWRDGLEPVPSDGWLRTGDLGEMDESGNVFFRGRKKDVIVTAAGLNVYPADIEAALDRQPEIKMSAVVGVEGPRGPEPVAVVIPRRADGGGEEVAAAVERANATLARHQQVLTWHLWPDADFPRTPTQKVRKRDIVARLGLERGPGATSDAEVIDDNSQNGVEVSEASLLGLISSLQPPAPGSNPTDPTLRLDSLGRVELMSAIEDRYQIEVDEASFTEATTVADIERLVREGGGATEKAAQYPYPEWAQRFPVTWFRVAFFYAVVLPITCVLCWVRVRGREHVEGLRGPALFVSNHVTFVDHALILSALPGRIRRRFAVAQEGERLRRWRRSPGGAPTWTRLRRLAQYYLVVTIFNTFSLPQKSGFRRSFRFAGETVDRGNSVLVFPEGTRTDDGRLKPFRSGTGLLALDLDIPVVPVRIDGLFELKREGRRLFAAPGSVAVTFGEPVRYPRDEDPGRVAADLEARVANLGRPD